MENRTRLRRFIWFIDGDERLALAYNKDLQEDKEGMFDTAETILTSLDIMSGMIATMKVNKERMLESTQKDFSNATELADYLASKDCHLDKRTKSLVNWSYNAFKTATICKIFL